MRKLSKRSESETEMMIQEAFHLFVEDGEGEGRQIIFIPINYGLQLLRILIRDIEFIFSDFAFAYRMTRRIVWWCG